MNKQSIYTISMLAVAALLLTAFSSNSRYESDIELNDAIHSAHIENMSTDNGTLFFGFNSGKEAVQYGFKSIDTDFSLDDETADKVAAVWWIWNPASASASSFCWGSACGGSLCFGSACGISGCAGASVCGGSVCSGSVCGGSVCQGSVCGGSVCQGSICGGSVCQTSDCDGGGDFMMAINSFNYKQINNFLSIRIAVSTNAVLVSSDGNERYSLVAGSTNRIDIEGVYSSVILKEANGEKILSFVMADGVERHYKLVSRS